MMISSDEVIFSDNKKIAFKNFEDFCEIPEISHLLKDPEVLAWLMPKPRPSVQALAMVYVAKHSAELSFDFEEYKTEVPKAQQQDIDFNFVRKMLPRTKFNTGVTHWDLHFEQPESTEPQGNNAYITYFSGRYILGLLALIRSLRRFSDKKIIVLCSETEPLDFLLKEENLEIVRMKPIENPNSHGQARFKDTYNKLKIFDFLEYDKLIYIDSDCLILKNIDELFNLKTEISAAPDWGLKYANGFNSGVIVFTPSVELRTLIFDSLTKDINSSDGGDQGFLNEVLKDKITYIAPRYNYLKRNYDKRSWSFDKENISILHYVGKKPWDILDFDPTYENLNQLWLEVLSKEDLILLYKFNKVFASRREQKKAKVVVTTKPKKENPKEKPKENPKERSYIRKFLKYLWNKLP